MSTQRLALAAIALTLELFVFSTGGATPAAGARRPPANDGLPTRWYGVLESLLIFNHYGTTTTMKTSARATFTLTQNHPGSKRFPGEYDYLATGTLIASLVRVGGDCSWKGAGSIPLQPSNGGLRFAVTKTPHGAMQVHYGWLSGSDVGGHDPALKVALRCPDYSATVPESITWLGVHNYNRTSARARAIQGRWDYAPVAEGFRTWCLTRKQSDLDTCKADELQAVARVSGSSLRAATRTLDGSRSKGDIKSYEWTFEQAQCASGGPCAGYCDTVGPTAGARKRGARATIKPLCAVEATLTVSDGQDEDADTVLVPVTPRAQGWKTQVFHRWIPTPATSAPSGAPRGTPEARCQANGMCTVELHGGLNVPDPQGCSGHEGLGSRILCPLLDGRGTWKGRGYTLATIADPGGPFDGYSYVGASTLVVRRLAYINPDLLSGSFYDYNKAHQGQVDALIEATKEHEGFGAPGKPGTGHSQIMRDIITGSGGLNDPRHEIEVMFAPAASAVQDRADKEIKRIDELADTRSEDPLNQIGRFALWFQDPADGVWTPGLISVP
jgi:hypothetical protein